MPGRTSIPTLERITALCRLLGDPQLVSPVIHVTGTNGKGSTVGILAELLSTVGLTVGTFTSPDLTAINERITRNGEPITDPELIEVLASLAALEPLLDGRPTRFDLLTAAAFRWFADVAVDVAVVEVGLGGRWDATNVVEPVVAVVTNVSEDHLEVLGPTLTDVAREKAGIIKKGSHLILGETDAELSGIFLAVADTVGAASVWRRGSLEDAGDFGCDANDVAVGGRLIDLRTPSRRYEQVFLGLHGAHQGDNAAGALAAAEAFFASALHDDVVRTAFASVRVPGRLEIVGAVTTRRSRRRSQRRRCPRSRSCARGRLRRRGSEGRGRRDARREGSRRDDRCSCIRRCHTGRRVPRTIAQGTARIRPPCRCQSGGHCG